MISRKFHLLCLIFVSMILLYSCRNNGTYKNTENEMPKGKISLLHLDDQNTSRLNLYFADSSYCTYLERNHSLCRRYLNIFNQVDKKLKLQNEENYFDGEISVLNNELDSLIRIFNVTYPNKKGKMSFVEYCGGYCMPIYREFGIPILPDRYIEAEKYWKKQENINYLKKLIAKIEDILYRFNDLYNSGVENSSIIKKYSDQKVSEIFTSDKKTTAEYLLELARLKKHYVHQKENILNSKER